MSNTDVEKAYNHGAHDNADERLAPSAYRLAPGPHPPFRQFGNPAPLGT
jgi:hypothetical protein